MNDNSNDTDERILKLLKEDDTLALSLMFHSYYKSLYNSVKRVIRNGDDAEDLVIELFQAVWEKRHSLNISKPIRNYLLSAAYHRALNYTRNRGRTKASLTNVIHMSSVAPSAQSTDTELQTRELRRVIKTAISLLPGKMRVTFLMSRNLGMTYKEIARHLHVSEKAVEKNMSKALKLLRVLLAPYLKLMLFLIS